MRDVIQKMLEAEAEAKRIVAEAEAEADRIRAEARRQAQHLLETARRQARDEADRLIAEADEQADRDRGSGLSLAAERIEQEVGIDPERRREAVETVVRAVAAEG